MLAVLRRSGAKAMSRGHAGGRAMSSSSSSGKRTVTVREALNEGMTEEMKRDKSVFVFGEEVGQYDGAYKVTKGMLGNFGADRVMDTPITEMGFTGLAVGAAQAGMRPVVEFMTWNFALQAIDHIVNSAAKAHYMSGGQVECPIVFRGPNGPSAGVAAQHSQCFAAWYSSVPGLKVLMPYDAKDAKGMIKAAVRDPNPVVVLEHELMYGVSFEIDEDVASGDYVTEFGKARVMREGTDVSLVTYSKPVGEALLAAEELQKKGISAEVINLGSIRPIDRDAIVASVKKTSRLVTIDQGWPQNGVGAEVASIVNEEAFDYLDAPPARVTGADVPMPYAANLERAAQVQVQNIVNVAERVCYRNK